ncbi:MAG TPA: SPFH domain-containing protein [Gammaproteobacteria bacterium]|nr:SPFH domain-containing protein [Gammaproteobacteria bacterium]
MSASRANPPTVVEREVPAFNGWMMLVVNLLIVIGAIVFFVASFRAGARGELTGGGFEFFIRTVSSLGLLVLGIIMLTGHFTLQPNEARVLILFGAYKGTVRTSGFHWANPFYARTRGKIPWQVAPPSDPKSPTKVNFNQSGGIVYKPLRAKISLRAHNFNSEKLKVNDKRGNPVEIAAVIVWRVEDTAQAAFEVEDYESYVQVQSESAIRSIASMYAYDHGEEHEPTLRSGGDEVSHELKKELEVRLAKAGVVVNEARLTHLAYAPEIAHAMLRRQQAEAVIAARAMIVQGAVSMVDMALRELTAKDVVKLDEERKAAMVSNLLVVLCGTAEAQPVINTGTLYS